MLTSFSRVIPGLILVTPCSKDWNDEFGLKAVGAMTETIVGVLGTDSGDEGTERVR